MSLAYVDSRPMQLLLIRHARNDWVGKRLAGRTPGVHLNEEGRKEAASLAQRLDGYPIDAVYSSPLERALETASYLCEPRGQEPIVLGGITEVEYGAWTGQALDDLRSDPLWATAMHNPSSVRFPEGESICDVQSRVIESLESLRSAHDSGAAAAVAHGDVIKLAVAHYTGLHVDLFQRIEVSTASLTVLSFSSHGPRLQLLNHTGSIPAPPHGEASGRKQRQGHDRGAG